MGRATTAGEEVLRRQDAVVSPDWLQERLHDPGVRVVEVDASPRAYREGHIEGAVLWDIYRDMREADYQLVGAADIERLIARSGITPDSTVVFYGYGPALGLWLLKVYGHRDARILDCSRAEWQGDGRPWSAEVPEIPATSYPLPAEDAGIRARHGDVEAAMGASVSRILDVRSKGEYLGEQFWPSGGMEEGGRAGRVPGAVHQSIDGIYDDRGAFRSVDDLARILGEVDLSGDGDLITYCTIGGRAATAWFVLTYLLDRPGVRVYDGSWAEWGRMPSKPVETGSGRKETAMAGLIRKSLDTPEETRSFEGGSGQLQLVNLAEGPVGRATFLPGWKWSEHVKPIVQTDSCQAAHMGYFVSGRMKVVMNDGEEMEYGPGDFAIMAPGHDAWVVGDEPCVVIDWQGFADYAKR